jgi:threonine aldolase
MELIDLRSDTVTLPTRDMLDAIKNAKLGDDVYKEDPTVNKLEDIAAKKMGKECALLVPSGTMGNLVSLLSNTKRGDCVILEAESHLYNLEVGGLSTIAGLIPWPIKGDMGVLHPRDIEAAIKPNNIHFPENTLVCIENTHNRAGGTITTPNRLREISKICNDFGLKLYMDGSRIFNAAVALKMDVKEFTKHIDNLMFCLSKGLSCPIGSIIVGNEEFIKRARKNRKLLGGGMRQAGVIAAPGIIALETMIKRLDEDHKNAKILSKGLAEISGLFIDLKRVQTNLVYFDVSDLKINAKKFKNKLKEHNILAGSIGRTKIRLVTHRGIEKKHIEQTLNIIENVVKEFKRSLSL